MREWNFARVLNQFRKDRDTVATQSAEAESSNRVRQRSDIEERYKWRLEDIYESDADWRKDFEKVKAMMPSISEWQGKLAESGKSLCDCFEHRDNTSNTFQKLFIYAHLKLDEDNRNSTYQSMTDEVAALSTRYAEASSYITPEIMAISDKRMTEMYAEHEPLQLYRHHLDEMRRMREHILSPAEEKLMALAGNVTRGPSQIFRMIDDADLQFAEVTDDDGNRVKLTKQRYYELLESTKREVRKEAAETFTKGYSVFLNTLGASLSASVYKDLFYARARKYEGCLPAALDGDNIPVETYRNLVNAVSNNLPILHRYVSLRRKVLGLDKIYSYDMYVPLVPDAKIKIKYDEAVDRVLAGLWPLGEEYHDNLKKGFESGWVDVYETEGKGSGAYSWGTYATHPYVLMNYNNTLDNMFTLAHEMGHAMHSFYSNANQPYVYSGHSIFTAEVASTANEALLMHYLLDRSEDDDQKAYLLSYQIQSVVGTFFTQVMYSTFEDKIHQDVEQGKPLSQEQFRQTYREIYEKFWGKELSLHENADISCLRIPHFYRAFYVYQYATSFAASAMIAERLLRGDDEQQERYLNFLKAGQCKYPIDILRDAGVDMTTPEPVEAVVRLFSRLLDQLEELLVDKS